MASSWHARDEKASVAASQRADKSAAFCPSMRKRPSANSEMNLRRPASASDAVVQRAETRAGLGNSSTERADKIMDELRALGHYPKALTAATGCEYNLRKKYPEPEKLETSAQHRLQKSRR